MLTHFDHFWRCWHILTIFGDVDTFWPFLEMLTHFDHFWRCWHILTIFGDVDTFWPFLEMLTHFDHFWRCWHILTIFGDVDTFWSFLEMFWIPNMWENRGFWDVFSDVFNMFQALGTNQSITGWWFGTWLLFSMSYMGYWDVILPIDFHIFQRGRSTTNKYMVFLNPNNTILSNQIH